MNAKKMDYAHVLEALDALRQEVGRLNERIGKLEAAPALPAAAPPPAPAAAEAAVAGVDAETAMVIAAAVAAYLGKKPSIRQIRLLGSVAWAQQGRVSIQASYAVSANPH
jgi:methylmalonyl-CoA carboxyltransferase 12S subunit